MTIFKEYKKGDKFSRIFKCTPCKFRLKVEAYMKRVERIAANDYDSNKKLQTEDIRATEKVQHLVPKWIELSLVEVNQAGIII